MAIDLAHDTLAGKILKRGRLTNWQRPFGGLFYDCFRKRML
jgi:hypothetical protein